MVSFIITLVNSIYLKDISEKGAMKIKTTKRSIILLILQQRQQNWKVS